MLFASCAIKPQPANTTRPCFQWIASQGQEVRIYKQDALTANLDTKPGDAVMSGWCLTQYNQDLVNEIRRLAH